MTNEDKEALKEVLLGGRNFILIVVLMSLIVFVLNFVANYDQSTPSNQRFEVVDRYDSRCDVVRYNPNHSARYSYFLNCKDT